MHGDRDVLSERWPPAELVTAIEALWSVPRPGPENLFYSRPFVRLKEVCSRLYPNATDNFGFAFALGDALRSLGLPSGLPQRLESLSLPPLEAARQLNNAFVRKHVLRVHLCPLEWADEPRITFGSNRVGRFTAAELMTFAEAGRIRRVHPEISVDWEKLAQFDWLIVEEEVVELRTPSERAMPILADGFGQDFGRIEPHESKLPPSVEAALFFILLAPWEHWLQSAEAGWRPFTIPRVYTADRDLFVRLPRPIAPEDLTFVPEFYTELDGETYETEVPARGRNLVAEASAATAMLNDDVWRSLLEARKGNLFETPVEHFLVRGYLSDGIDEFLAHLTAIEAALGVEGDHIRKKGNAHGNVGATSRMRARVSALLGDTAAGAEYAELFKLRSAFVHGRRMTAISSAERIRARTLARRVVKALFDAAAAGEGTAGREHYLARLLDLGRNMGA
jgi:hypothetical protein